MNLLIFMSLISPFNFVAQNITPKHPQDHFIDFCLRNITQDSIPTSIKLAQAIIESNWGKSRLSKSLNFHGIKCFKCEDFVLLSDDLPNEKFRVFKSPRESFDYNNFLLRKHFVIGDYRVWAKSLTWYATDKKYSQLIIKIIEKYRLYVYDKTDYPDSHHWVLHRERNYEGVLSQHAL